jgi:hypothetical protein
MNLQQITIRLAATVESTPDYTELPSIFKQICGGSFSKKIDSGDSELDSVLICTLHRTPEQMASSFATAIRTHFVGLELDVKHLTYVGEDSIFVVRGTERAALLFQAVFTRAIGTLDYKSF